jgi:hypothetical protein
MSYGFNRSKPKRVCITLSLVSMLWCARGYAVDVQFSYTGAQQTWVVPGGVTSVTITATGARGGNAGGLGARATGTYAVTPGETLYIYVGGRGGQPAGGFNGGGSGGSDTLGNGGGGGGASDVREGGSALANRIIVAGGGGGKSGGGNAGGDGGTPDGTTGGGSGYSGQGATISAGGAGGAGDETGGQAGTQAGGGSGGGVFYAGYGGGGGGGGYYGGGGGGDAYDYNGLAGGGGGGSSNTLAGTGASYTAGVGTGDGEVVISYVGDSTVPVWYSNGSFTAGAQGAAAQSDTVVTVNVQPAGDDCDQAGGGGALACRSDDTVVSAVRIYYAAEASVPVNGSCSNDVDRASAAYQDFDSSPLTADSENVTGLNGDTWYCFEAAIVDAAGNVSAAGAREVAARTLEKVQTVFGYTGAQQTWLVPDDVTRVTIAATGAAGGEAGTGTTGKGSTATGTYAVTPGETLYIYVGGKGGDGTAGGDVPGGSGGWNGGGKGGDCDGTNLYCFGGSGAGGGGASDVRRGGTSLANRIIVGAGGGGETWTKNGGTGGGETGSPGTSGAGAGGGGTQSAGGSGGASGGHSGSLGVGGAGGEDDYGDYAGGGGGGGYYGGGGGGINYSYADPGGGGGGSGYVGAGSDTSYTLGTSAGDGSVSIIYYLNNAPSGPLKGAVMIVN